MTIAAAAALLAACGSGAPGGSGSEPVAWAQTGTGDGAVVTTAVGAVTVPEAAQQAAVDAESPVFFAAEEAAWASPGTVSSAVAGAEDAAMVAEVLDVPQAGLEKYLYTLTPARLLHDTAVTEHRPSGPDDGRPAVLEAGTAVLVDRFATPRIRVASGTPLTPLPGGDSAPADPGAEWPGYAPAGTAIAAPAEEALGGVLLAGADGELTVGGPEGLLCPRLGMTFDDWCQIVAYADLDGSGVEMPIAAAHTGGPAAQLITFDDRGQATAAESGLDASRSGVGPMALGSKTLSLEQARAHLLFGAFDVTGDGIPELVMWTHNDGTATYASNSDVRGVAEFKVFQRGAGGSYTALPAPMEGMTSGGETWGASLGWGEYAYRCTGDGIAGIDKFDDEQRLVSLTWSGSTWVEGETTYEKYQPAADPALPKIFDCDDHARRTAAVNSAAIAAEVDGTTARSCEVRADGETVYTEMTSGRLACDRVTEIVTDYFRLMPTEATGSARTVDADGWVCQLAPQSENRLGTCQSLGQDWEFQLFDQPID